MDNIQKIADAMRLIRDNCYDYECCDECPMYDSNQIL